MPAITIGPRTFEALVARRNTPAEQPDDVLRHLLGLDPAATGGPLMLKGVCYPDGTQFRARYKGRLYAASVRNGTWTDASGVIHASPSHAAGAITGTNVNGWRFWSVLRPGAHRWRRLDHDRTDQQERAR